ncbi:uncharacterized protein SCHCODRAFT_02753104 [Schizophyllum commune H4-8]|uniref:uncharacterized protein n=1 Tax=Schizophyllum commune (strain H4-8 / FGSC 9210) TaxID=578458 RepID=UPI00215E41DB|nr:uncharacterized protein SCHCODRAFT_02753104 [Schizophyllum commune H4-8]KAI5885783.1 hypothetical protein SCHCODRAFT_02753104 [Schizophyllum commune H4-8]
MDGDTRVRSVGPALDGAKDEEAIVEIWRAAVERYERDTGMKLALLLADSVDVVSASSIESFIDERAESFALFRAGGGARARKWLKPIAATVQLLSSCLGDAVTLPFSPMKAVFGAIGVAIKLSIEVTKDYDAAMDAFETIADHLARIKIVGANETLREPSVRVLSQTLVVMGVITQLQRDGRFKTWLHKFKQSHELTEALADLQRLATNHHETLSAITLLSVERTMDLLGHSMTSVQQEQDMTRTCLTRIVKVAQEMHEMIRSNALTIDQQVHANRAILEDIQGILLLHSEAYQHDKEDDEIDRIFAWLRCPDFSIKINNLLQQRARSTGSWFLDGEEFAKFKVGAARFLWLHGKAGSGKSTIIAAAERDIRTICNTPGSSLALFHVFDATNNAIKRNLEVLLASLLCQLVHQEHRAVDFLSRARREHLRGMRQPSLDELRYYIKHLLGEGQHVFLTIDALDESDDIGEVLRLLGELREREQISILVSSRSELAARDELERLADGHVLMSTEVVARDIGIMLNQTLSRDGPLAKIQNPRSACRTLTSGADGNFRWVALQVQQLSLVAAFPLKVVERLASLPPDLRALYDEALSKIDERDHADVRRLFMWLLFSHSSLRKEQFAEIMSFDYSRPVPVFSRRFRPSSANEVIALVGSTFLTVDPQSGDVRFAHASVLEYLRALPPSSPFYNTHDVALQQLTATCVGYLITCGYYQDGWALELMSRGGKVPLYTHAAEHWLNYARTVNLSACPELEATVMYLLMSNEVQERWKKLWKIMNQPESCSQTTQPLYAAREALSPDLVDLILRYLLPDPNHRTPEMAEDLSSQWLRLTPIMFAITSGRGRGDRSCSAPDRRNYLVAKLIQAGADVNAFVRGRTPLHYAVVEGDIGIAKMLIRAGADVNEETCGRPRRLPKRGSPEYYAIRRTDSWKQELSLPDERIASSSDLLMHFTQIQTQWRHLFTEDLCTPLQRAVRRGDIRMVILLLRAGARTDMPDDAGVTPLHEATSRGLDKIVDRLLAAGARWKPDVERQPPSLRLEYANPSPPGTRTRAWSRGRSMSFPPLKGVHSDTSKIKHVYTLRPFAASVFGRHPARFKHFETRPTPDLENWWETQVDAFEEEDIPPPPPEMTSSS